MKLSFFEQRVVGGSQLHLQVKVISTYRHSLNDSEKEPPLLKWFILRIQVKEIINYNIYGEQRFQ